MKRIIKLIIALAAGVLPAANLKAQSLDPFSQYGYFTPGVEAFAMTKYGGLTPSLYTGAMSLSVPLYTYTDPDFTIPISLEYNFDGYRPALPSGTVGYGWHLNCGGIITREVRGIPDEGDINDTGSFMKGWRDKVRELDVNTYMNIHSFMSRGRALIPEGEALSLLLSYDPFSDTPLHRQDNPNGGISFMYDLAPDIYHFNFLGHSGDFMFGEDGDVMVFNSDIPDGEIRIEFIDDVMFRDRGQILIKTGDGTKYMFVNGDFCSTPNIDDDIYRPHQEIASWVLSTVSAPNGRKVVLDYEGHTQTVVSARYGPIKDGRYLSEGVLESDCYQGDIPSDYEMKWNINNTSVRALKQVKVCGARGADTADATISFTYDSASSNEYAPSHYDDENRIASFISGGQTRLSQITVSNGSEEVDRFILNHSHAENGTPKMFLSSVTGLKNGTHSFSYNMQDFTFPKNNTQGTDHWGFWNGETISDIRAHLKNTAWIFGQPAMISPLADTLLTPGEVQPPSEERPVSAHLYDQIVEGDTSKDPSFAHAMAGALTSVTYPTGGTSTIEYEPNTATRRINYHDGLSSLSLVLEDCPEDGMQIGGVRVRSITDNAFEGDLMRTTMFSYSEGILTQMPKYSVKVSYEHRFAPSSPQHTLYGCLAVINIVGFDNCCGFQLCRDSHITYPEVSVTHSDGSTTAYEFTSTGDYIDTHAYGWSGFKHPLSDEDEMSPLPDQIVPVCLLPPSLDYSRIRGKEKRMVEYDAQGNIVASVENSYSLKGSTIPNIFYNSIFSYNHDSYTAFSPQLTRTVRTENGVTTTTDMEYNALGQVQMQTVSSQVNSPEDGVPPGSVIQTTRVRTRYLHESRPSTPLTGAADAIVVTDVSADSGSERLVSAQSCTYGTGSNPFPSSVTTYESSGVALSSGADRSDIFSRALSGNSGNSRTVSYAYDNLFRPVNVTLPGAETLTYSWQNGVRVTQKTQGSAANMTSYQWKDLVGLSSLTTPDGQRQSYVYDDRNRLKRISDRNGKPVTRYNYKMKNESTTNN